MAEWSKALRSGRSLFGGVGSNPTLTTFAHSSGGGSWCSGSTSDSKSDNGGSIPSEVTFTECVAGKLLSPRAAQPHTLPHGAVGSASGC